MTSRIISLAALLIALTGGCGKKPKAVEPTANSTPIPSAPADTALPTPPPVPGETVPEAPAPEPAAANVPPGSAADIPYQLELLSTAVKHFYLESKPQHAPKDFKELISKGYLGEEPSPPKGKRYVIDPATLTVRLQ